MTLANERCLKTLVLKVMILELFSGTGSVDKVAREMG